MDTKLTLSIRSDVVEKAKAWARQTGTSICTVEEAFLERKVHAAAQKELPLEAIRRLGEGLPQLSDEEYQQRRQKKLSKKYGS